MPPRVVCDYLWDLILAQHCAPACNPARRAGATWSTLSNPLGIVGYVFRGVAPGPLRGRGWLFLSKCIYISHQDVLDAAAARDALLPFKRCPALACSPKSYFEALFLSDPATRDKVAQMVKKYSCGQPGDEVFGAMLYWYRDRCVHCPPASLAHQAAAAWDMLDAKDRAAFGDMFAAAQRS